MFCYTHIILVERRSLGPLQQMLVDVPIVAPQYGVQDPVWEVEGVDKSHGVRTELGHEGVDVTSGLADVCAGQVAVLIKSW